MVKEAFEDLKSNFAPDLILTHHDDDRHQDHRLVSQLTWNTWRDHMILEYEIMRYAVNSDASIFACRCPRNVLGRADILVIAAAARVCRTVFLKKSRCLIAFPPAEQCAVKSIIAIRCATLPTNSSETDFASSYY